MWKKLYVERWLLDLKDEVTRENGVARVRALDAPGGKRLALSVQLGPEGLEIAYRKRLTGPRMVVAATSCSIITFVKNVHVKLLGQHQKLLENGLRRFLGRSIRLLEALETHFQNDPNLPARMQFALEAIDGTAGARPAALARRKPGSPSGFEVVPGAAFGTGAALRFAGIQEGALVDLTRFIPGEQPEAVPPVQPSPQNVGHTPASSMPGGVELVALPGAAAAGAVLAGGMVPPGPGAPVPEIPPEETQQAAGGLLNAVGNLADGADAVVEGVSTAADCLGDSACSAPDCSGLDLSGIDCGGLDCSFG